MPLIVGGVAVIVLFAAVLDPATPWAPKCIFKALTGYDCPGCGMQRALHAAVRGDFGAAWRLNPFIFFAVPLAALYALTGLAGERKMRRLYAALHHPVTVFVIAGVIIAWWIGRNV